MAMQAFAAPLAIALVGFSGPHSIPRRAVSFSGPHSLHRRAVVRLSDLDDAASAAAARETAAAVLEDLAAGGVAGYGEGTSWADWRRIDGVEKSNAKKGAPRAKFSDVEGMLDAASSA